MPSEFGRLMTHIAANRRSMPAGGCSFGSRSLPSLWTQ